MPVKPFFTIIIPTYNRASLIEKTLETLFNQSFKDFEIIVVDDHSTDHTESVLSPLVKKRLIKYIRHERNYERARSRNTGMELAEGEFLTFLDSDDYMYKDCLMDAYNYIKGNPDISFFHNTYEVVTPERKLVKRLSFPPINDPINEIVKGNFLSCIGVFLHKSLYSKLRFDTAAILSGSEDYEFWLRVLTKTNYIGRINKINSAVVEHGNRSVNNINLEKLKERIDYLMNKVSEDKDLKNTYARNFKVLQSHLYLYISSIAAISKNTSEALKYWKIAIKKDFGVVFTIKSWHYLFLIFYKQLK